jgi:histidinol-phosphate/aromatic aminotransferase/cobyric acid decarboxylase-like protein/choline kinase
MQAIILAAGRARRMQPISDHVHKALLPIGTSTILGRIVDNLEAIGVTRLTVVTGYRAQDVQAFLETRHPDLDVRYVHNSRFERTNNIVSLAMAFDSMSFDDDIILCECDLLLDPEVLTGLKDSPEPNVAVVDRWRPGMDGTVVTVADGFVEGVYPPDTQGPEFNYRDTFKTLNIYRFSKTFVRSTLHPIMSAYANSVDDNCYYEVVLAMLAGIPRHRIAAHVVDTAAWIEVDDPNDLEIARFHFEPESRAEILDRSFGGHWNFNLLDYSFIANQYFPPPALTAMMRRALPDLLSSYGSAQAVLNRKMALFVQCDPAHILMLNGASQVYPILHRLWSDDTVAIPSPTFGEYGRHFSSAIRYVDGPGVDLRDLHDAADRARRLVVVNPNNPSGTVLETADVFALAKDHPETTVLVDESFIATSGQPSIVPMVEANPLENVMVLTSLSKVLGVPGLRVGSLYSRDQEALAAIANELPIWGNSSLAEFFVEMLVKFRPALERSIESTLADAAQFSDALRCLPCVEEVCTGAGSFLLVKFGNASVAGAGIRRQLLEQHRIEVKDVSGRFADGGVRLRLAVRRPGDNRRLLAALASVLAERE